MSKYVFTLKQSFYGLLFLVLLVLSGTQASAATINVTTVSDGFLIDGQCGLREAVNAANQNANFNECSGIGLFGSDTINLINGTYDISVGGGGASAGEM